MTNRRRMLLGAVQAWKIVSGVLHVYRDMYRNDIDNGLPWDSRKNAITSVVIHEGVTFVTTFAFMDCYNMSSITFSDSLTSIFKGVFSGCSALTSITIPDGVTSIGGSAFEGCTGLTSVTMGSGETQIGNNMFSGCSALTSVTIPNSVTSIGYSVFYGCTGLTSINYAGTKAQWNAITKSSGWDSNTGEYTIHCTDGDVHKNDWTLINGVLNVYAQESLNVGIGVAVPWENNIASITDIVIHNGVSEVSADVFAESVSLETVVINEGVEIIRSGAFADCTSLTAVTLPVSITEIYSGVFSNCNSITAFNYNGTTAQWNAITKRTNWKTSSSISTIHCTDGDIL